MDLLNEKFKDLKKKIGIQATEKNKLNNDFKEALAQIFNDLKNPEKYIRDFYLKDSVLVVNTKNKIFSNELFLNKADILRKITDLGNFKISELKIK